MKQILFGFFHENIDGGIVSYAIWHIIPIPVLLFACVGLFLLARARRYEVLVPIAVGLAYWAMYAFVSQVFIIEYNRITAITALLSIVPAAIAFEWLIGKLPKKQAGHPLSARFLVAYAAIASIYLASTYPVGHPWTYFLLHQGENVLIPSPPVNRNLTADDLRLFAGIRGDRFVAPPWKGLTIGVATENYPLETKPATIGVEILPYSEFMDADCASKSSLAAAYSIDYVYSSPFDCPGFSEEGMSGEGLRLYTFNGQR